MGGKYFKCPTYEGKKTFGGSIIIGLLFYKTNQGYIVCTCADKFNCL